MFYSLCFIGVINLSQAKEIKVLCYVGHGAGEDNPDVRNQIMCMGKNLVPGVTFTAKKSEVIDSSTLSGWDVVLAPGGEIGYHVDNPQFNVRDIQAFVKSGKGFYGTCAGAYAGCLRTEADENGLINPDTNRTVKSIGFNETTGKPIYPADPGMGLSQAVCHTFWHVAPADFKFSQKGQEVFSVGQSDIEIDHHNGPTMDGGGKDTVYLAKFDSTSQQGMGAMVIDKYGEGPVILISPHPEHDKDQNCGIVARAAAFAGGAITKEQFMNMSSY